MTFNRPLIKLLTHVIESRLILKFRCDYNSYISGSKKPYLWKVFSREWKRHKEKSVFQMNEYHTDTRNFMCSCPSWLRSQVFLCKHIVKDMDHPHYHQVTMNRKPPFVVIDRESKRLYMYIDEPLLALSPNRDKRMSITNLLDVNSGTGVTCATPSLVTPHINFNDQDDHSPNICLVIADEMVSQLQWLISHVNQLSLHPSGKRQLQFLHGSLFKSVRKYNDDVRNNLQSRSTPRTWGNSNTLYLP